MNDTMITTARRRPNRSATSTAVAAASATASTNDIIRSNDRNVGDVGRRRRMSHATKLRGQVVVVVEKRKTKNILYSTIGRWRMVDVALLVSIAIKLTSLVYHRYYTANYLPALPAAPVTRRRLEPRPSFELHLSTTPSSGILWTYPHWVHRWSERKMTFHHPPPLFYNRRMDMMYDDSSVGSSYLNDDGGGDDSIDQRKQKIKYTGMFLRDEHFDDHKEQLNSHGYAIVDDVVYHADDYSEQTWSAIVASHDDIRVNHPDPGDAIIDESHHPAFEYWNEFNVRNYETNHNILHAAVDKLLVDDEFDQYYTFDDDVPPITKGMRLDHDKRDEESHTIITDDGAFDPYYAFDDDFQRGTKGMGFDKDDDERSIIGNGRKSNSSGVYESDFIQGVCTPPEFYRKYQPTCNELHASLSGYHWLIGEDYSRRWIKRKYPLSHNISRLSKYLSQGYYRDAFLIRQQSFVLSAANEVSTEWDEVVFKTMQTMNANSDDKYGTLHQQEDMRKDAMVMELLSSSPRVTDIYSHCAMSSVTEFAPTDMETYIMPTTGFTPKSIVRGSKRKMEPDRPLNDHISPEEKLEIALEMAKCIAVLHGFKDGPIVHVDVKTDQFFRGRDGIIKMIDYNRAEALLYDTENDAYCRWTNGQPSNGQFRAPEESVDGALSETIDVFSLGNALYSLLTGKMVWENEGVDVDEMHNRIIHGYTVPIPDHYKDSPSSSALVGVIRDCWTYSAKYRISIFEVIHSLEEAVARISTK